MPSKAVSGCIVSAPVNAPSCQQSLVFRWPMRTKLRKDITDQKNIDLQIRVSPDGKEAYVAIRPVR